MINLFKFNKFFIRFLDFKVEKLGVTFEKGQPIIFHIFHSQIFLDKRSAIQRNRLSNFRMILSEEDEVFQLGLRSLARHGDEVVPWAKACVVELVPVVADMKDERAAQK